VGFSEHPFGIRFSAPSGRLYRSKARIVLSYFRLAQCRRGFCAGSWSTLQANVRLALGYRLTTLHSDDRTAFTSNLTTRGMPRYDRVAFGNRCNGSDNCYYVG
jgi:hypothetical protein